MYEALRAEYFENPIYDFVGDLDKYNFRIYSILQGIRHCPHRVKSGTYKHIHILCYIMILELNV